MLRETTAVLRQWLSSGYPKSSVPPHCSTTRSPLSFLWSLPYLPHHMVSLLSATGNHCSNGPQILVGVGVISENFGTWIMLHSPPFCWDLILSRTKTESTGRWSAKFKWLTSPIGPRTQAQFSFLVNSLGIPVRMLGFKSWLCWGTEPLIRQSPHLGHGHYFERLLER